MIEYLAITDGSIAVIDTRHFERISKFVWSGIGSGIYRCIGKQRNGRWRSKVISLASEIMQDYISIFDHKDRNYLNNMEVNLRPATYSQNNCNKIYDKTGCTSKFRGVCRRASGTYQAQIFKNSKCISLGSFLSEVDAALAYNTKAIELYGEFAILNQIT